MRKYTPCENCDGEGYELEERDVSFGSNPNREPDFQLVPTDEKCIHCGGNGDGYLWCNCEGCSAHICLDDAEKVFGEDDDNAHIEYYICPICDDLAMEVDSQ